jgi:hypothetical protein
MEVACSSEMAVVVHIAKMQKTHVEEKSSVHVRIW